MFPWWLFRHAVSHSSERCTQSPAGGYCPAACAHHPIAQWKEVLTVSWEPFYVEVRLMGNIHPLNVHNHGHMHKNWCICLTHNVLACGTGHKEQPDFFFWNYMHTHLFKVFFPFMHSRDKEKKMILFVQRWFRDLFWRLWHVCCGSFCIAENNLIKVGSTHFASSSLHCVSHRAFHACAACCLFDAVALYIFSASQVCHKKLTSVIWTALFPVFIHFECKVISVGEVKTAHREGLWIDLRNLFIREIFYKLYTQDSIPSYYVLYPSLLGQWPHPPLHPAFHATFSPFLPLRSTSFLNKSDTC